MAVTKIHPIKTTLKKAIDYICNGDKPMMKSMLQRTCVVEKMLIKNLNLLKNNLIQEQRY